MKLLYINEELATADGSNAHALGMLAAFKKQLGDYNVYSFPSPQDGSKVSATIGKDKLKQKLTRILQYVRFVRKKILSIKKSKAYISELENVGFIPTHVLARSTVFDVTAVYVAKHFHAKLVYEINAPMYYECTVIRKAPLKRRTEHWEKYIINKADYVYVVSKVCQDMLCKHYNINSDKFVVIPNGYMGDLYSENEYERQEIREEIRSKESLSDRFVVTFVGSLKVWHGIKSFCGLAKNLKGNTNVHFMVIGDGEMRDEIIQYVKTHDNMTFKGKLNYEVMKQYLYASDLGLMPYNNQDNFYFSPLKMFDMIGASLPFIGTSQAQIKEIVDEYFDDDFLLDTNDYGYVTLALERIMGSHEIYHMMKTKVEKNRLSFTWNARVKTLLASIDEYQRLS